MADDAEGATEDAAAEAADNVTEEAEPDAAEPDAAEPDVVEADGVEAEPAAVVTKTKVSHLTSRDRVVLAIGLVVVVALAAVGGFIAYRGYQQQRSTPQREVFLEGAKRGAQNLTTIDYNHADADVQRVLDSATGTFYDDFNRRAPSFTDVVKQVRSKSTGTVTEAGVESIAGDTGKVLVAVTVNTEVADGPPQPVRAFRMRLTVQKLGGDAKVSNVEFVQ